MGYTHYWKNDTTISTNDWDNSIQTIQAIIGSAEDGLLSEYGEESNKPVLDWCVMFNGVDDNAHETLTITKEFTDFDFCKTACKPYDKYVVAVLMTLAHNCGGFSWSSDGDSEDHKEGLELFNKYK
tara:strand:+ start:1123 stop:1500 length:378 start_codon:yes stop_codon:yes gene_type:complete